MKTEQEIRAMAAHLIVQYAALKEDNPVAAIRVYQRLRALGWVLDAPGPASLLIDEQEKKWMEALF